MSLVEGAQEERVVLASPKEIRRQIVKTIARAKAWHLGPNLSMVEILHTLYERVMRVDPARPDWPGRDRLISKGSAAAVLYAVLASRGFFPAETLKRYNEPGSRIVPLVEMFTLPGVEASTASLGRGLSIGIGMALAGKRDGMPYRVYVVVGDGECQEGQIWEAAMLAPSLDLDNLTLIVDCNKLQGSNRVEDLIRMANLSERFTDFGWHAVDVDGHDCDALEAALKKPADGPKCLIAHTVKGKGVSIMENDVAWHYRSMTQAEVIQALRELR
ncbi:transketolase [Nonomuraea rhodomycinica]|uniref:transketolase n=1 Tax=Nonomuraea rhodomycinica TaxID=1712872 RepID=UPI001C37B153|nr:transketolase [Nonomuraea rhodomycinica]